jgi:hypothetical protein
MFDTDIRIRIADEGLAFVYSIFRAGEVVSAAEVRPFGAPLAQLPDTEVVPGYYGGSDVMD